MTEAVVYFGTIALGLFGYWAMFVVLLHRHVEKTRRERISRAMQQFAASLAVSMAEAARVFALAGVSMNEAAESLRRFDRTMQRWRR